jgi:hypothetical protein
MMARDAIVEIYIYECSHPTHTTTKYDDNNNKKQTNVRREKKRKKKGFFDDGAIFLFFWNFAATRLFQHVNRKIVDPRFLKKMGLLLNSL